MGQLQRTTAVSNISTTIVTAKAGRTINPIAIDVTNTDTAAHIVDFFNGAVATPIFTLFVPSDAVTGGAAFHADQELLIRAISTKMTAGNALKAASQNAVGGSGLTFTVDYGRL